MSFGSNISDNTLNNAAAQSEAIDVSDSQDGLQTPGQRPITPRELTTQSSTDSSIPDHSYEYSRAKELNEKNRHHILNTNGVMDSIPTFGKYVPDAEMICVYARIMVLQPGELLSKSVTNPYIVNSFILSVPNNFDRLWCKDIGFITSLINQAKVIVHRSFPFPHFDAFNVHYTLVPDGILYTYPSSGHCLSHRINIKELEDMDPDFRVEHVHQNTPPPQPYITITGVAFNACYDIVFLCYGIQQKPARTLPPNQNELLFLTELNILITTKLDAVATISKVLKLYHDYRNTVLRSHHRLPSSQPVFSKPTEPPRFQNTPSQPIQVITLQPYEQIQPLMETVKQLPPGTPYIPPHLRVTQHRPCPETEHVPMLPNNPVVRLPQYQPANEQQQIQAPQPLILNQQQQQQQQQQQPIMVHQQQQQPIMLHQERMQMAHMIRLPPMQQPIPAYMHRMPNLHRQPRPLRQPNTRPSAPKIQKHPRVQILDGTIPWKCSQGTQ